MAIVWSLRENSEAKGNKRGASQTHSDSHADRQVASPVILFAIDSTPAAVQQSLLKAEADPGGDAGLAPRLTSLG